MSLKELLKNNLSKNQNGFDYSLSNKQFWYSFYLEYFTDIIQNYFEWDGLPVSISRNYLEKTLCYNGYAGAFIDKNLGLIVQNGTMGNKLDIYDNPTVFNPTNKSLFNLKSRIPINWYTDDTDKSKAIIIANTNRCVPTTRWLTGFCEKLADIEQTIQLNRNAQIRPYIIIAEDHNIFSLKNIWNKLINGDPVVYVKAQKNKNGALENVQLSDMVQVLNTNTPFLLDKFHDEKNRVISQILTCIGVNNNPVDKAERLVSAEATSNNGLINASLEVYLKARKQSVERLNKCFDLNVKVEPSYNIKMFNTEQIYKELNNLGGGEDGEL